MTDPSSIGDFIVQHIHTVLNEGDHDILLLRRVGAEGHPGDYLQIGESHSPNEEAMENKARSLASEAGTRAWRLERDEYRQLLTGCEE
jgi:hypothetical protein